MEHIKGVRSWQWLSYANNLLIHCFYFYQVFSLRHAYAATDDINTSDLAKISLRKDQLVTVLDSKRDDWWLVSTFPEGDVGKKEGWVERRLLQHAECKC